MINELFNFFKAIDPFKFQFILCILLTVIIGAIISTCKLTQAYMTVTSSSGNNDDGVFIVDSKFQSLMFLVTFGISKAVANLLVGITADLYGRKIPMIVGWVLGFLVPIMVMLAPNWNTVVYSNIFLGFQQGICWSLCIFIMVDYAGPSHRGIAVGINETCG